MIEKGSVALKEETEWWRLSRIPRQLGTCGRDSFLCTFPQKKNDPGIQGKHFYPGKTIGDNIGRRMGDGFFFAVNHQPKSIGVDLPIIRIPY